MQTTLHGRVVLRVLRCRARESWARTPTWYRAVAVTVATLIVAASASYAAGHAVHHVHVELGGWLVLASLPLALTGTVLWLCAMVLRNDGTKPDHDGQHAGVSVRSTH